MYWFLTASGAEDTSRHVSKGGIQLSPGIAFMCIISLILYSFKVGGMNTVSEYKFE